MVWLKEEVWLNSQYIINNILRQCSSTSVSKFKNEKHKEF